MSGDSFATRAMRYARYGITHSSGLEERGIVAAGAGLAGMDKPAQTGCRATSIDDCAHQSPGFRTLMRAMMQAGQVVPVLCRYDAGLAGGTHRSGQSATTPIGLAKRHGQIRITHS
jgi:hypothetical protein